MTLHRGLLNWGIFLIILAAVPLAVQAGYVDTAAAGGLLRFWPLILIGIGLGLVLRFTPFHVLGGMLAAGTLGLLAGALLAGGVGSIAGTCLGPAGGEALEARSGPFGAPGARVDIELTCAELSVDRQPGGEWRLEADFRGNGAPRLDASAQRLSVASAPAPFLGDTGRRNIRLLLPMESSFGLYLTLNASRGRLVLGDGPLGDLNVTLNASDVDFAPAGEQREAGNLNMTMNASSGRLGLPAASARGTITLNASSLELCATPEAGVRIRYDGTLSGTNFDEAGLRREGDVWSTPNYDTADVHNDLDVDANVSSITLHRTGGCP